MPKEYTACKQSYMDKGVSEKVASARCAAMYYKRHGITVNEAAKKAGEATEPEPDKEIFDAILAGTEPTKKEEKEPGITVHGQEVQAVAKPLGDGLYQFTVTKVGALAYTSDGLGVTWTKPLLERMVHTWTGGVVSINHNHDSYGKIIHSWFEGEEVQHLLSVTPEMGGWIDRNPEHIGVSIEAGKIVVDEKTMELTEATGTNVTLVFPPEKAACPPEGGCKLKGTVDEKSTLDEKLGVKGENPMSEDNDNVQAIEHEKVVAELEATKKELSELQAFRKKAEDVEKDNCLKVIATFIDAVPYKESPICTLRVVSSALAEYKKKIEEEGITNSGASAAATKEIQKPKEEDDPLKKEAAAVEAYVNATYKRGLK